MNYNPYFSNPYNQFYGQNMQQQRMQPMPQEQYVPQQPIIQPTYKQVGLQGKSVDNVEVVKATDIPLDGSISYFPLTDGSAIVTKQLQQDGTSKTVVYKPLEDKEEAPAPKYLTEEQFNKKISMLSNDNLKSDIISIGDTLSGLVSDLTEIKNELRSRKGR